MEIKVKINTKNFVPAIGYAQLHYPDAFFKTRLVDGKFTAFFYFKNESDAIDFALRWA